MCFTRLNFSLLLNESYFEGRQSYVVCSSQLIRNQWPSVVELINAIWKKLIRADRNHVNYSDRDHCVTQGHRRTAWTQTHICPMTHTITWVTDMHDFIIYLHVPLFMCIHLRYFDSKWKHLKWLLQRHCLCQRGITALRLTEDFIKWIPAKNVRKHEVVHWQFISCHCIVLKSASIRSYCKTEQKLWLIPFSEHSDTCVLQEHSVTRSRDLQWEKWH